jgi:hypothetical protein
MQNVTKKVTLRAREDSFEYVSHVRHYKRTGEEIVALVILSSSNRVWRSIRERLDVSSEIAEVANLSSPQTEPSRRLALPH